MVESIVNMEQYKVLLPTSGTGSRLKEITANTNKALLSLHGKPTITYIIDSYPQEVTFVVTLGYLGNSVKTFLETNYPDRQFEFVWVDKYKGPGSSLGYSILKAQKELQCPFVFHACDGIFIEKIPPPDHNWIGGFVEDWDRSILALAEYRSHRMNDGNIVSFIERGVPGFDSLHIGLDGIRDYKLWWQVLEEVVHNDPHNTQISDVPILDLMMKRGAKFSWIPFKVWLDIGNLPGLTRAKEYLSEKEMI